MAAPIPGVVDMIDQSLLSRNLAAGYQMGLAGRQQRMAEEQMAEQQKRQKVEDAYRAADMLTKMDLPEETSTKLFQVHIIPTLNASYGMNIPTDTQWQPTMKKYLKQIATIAQSADIADADKPAMIKAAVMEAAAKGKDISSAAKPLLADIDEKLDIEAQYGMLPRTPSITQGMVTAPPSGSYEPTPQTMGLAERYKMPEQNVEAQPLADVAAIRKEVFGRLKPEARQKMVEAARPDLFGGGKKPTAYLDDMGQPQFLPEGQMPPAGWKPYKETAEKTYNIPNEQESFLLEQPQFDLTTNEGKKEALAWFRSPEGQAAWKTEKVRKEASAIRIAGAKTTAGEAAREPSRVRDDEIGMAKEYEAASKPFVNIKNIFEPAAKYAKGVETGRVNPSPAQDRDFVISFLKTITPTQAPEKWTMMNIDQLPPLPTRILRGIQNLVQGRQLDDQTRSEMAAAMFSRFETYNSDQAALEEATLRRAQNYGFKPENVVPRHHAIRPGGKKSEGGMGTPKTAEELLRQKGLLK